MEKYENMLQKNKQICAKKVEMAINCIDELVKNEQQVVVSTLVKTTGLSRAFFYQNKVVRAELEKAQNLQRNKKFVRKQNVAINRALEKEIEILKKKLMEKDEKIVLLERENEKLQKIAKSKELSIISGL